MTDTFQLLPMNNDFQSHRLGSRHHNISTNDDEELVEKDDFNQQHPPSTSSSSSSLLSSLPLSSFAQTQSLKKNKKKPYVSPSMQGYQQKMKLAQASKGIAYGSGPNVGRMSLKQLLLPNNDASPSSFLQQQPGTTSTTSMKIPIKYQVPIFQRRYCWTETQWQTLLMDAATITTKKRSTYTNDNDNDDEYNVHSLGRLTCTNVSSSSSNDDNQEEARSVILDGQQRFTTVTLLLAAIRDALWKRQQRSIQNNKKTKNKLPTLNHEKTTRSIREINQILFPDQEAFEQWMNQSNNDSEATLHEGIELNFAKLIPTYCDRWSYYSAILPPSDDTKTTIANRLTNTAGTTTGAAFHRPLVAKKYYDGMLSMFSNEEVFQLLDGLYHKLTMLLFPIDIGADLNRNKKKNQHVHEPGTEDLMVVYERLAIRDATLCVPSRSNEYVTMSGLDMIRNALLGNFAKEAQALEFYQSYWLPMERMAATYCVAMASAAATASNEQENKKTNNHHADGSSSSSYQQQQQEEEGTIMHSMMSAFLDQENNNKEEEEKLEEGTVGGLLYVRFQLWQDRMMMLLSSSSMTAEEATRQQGQAMLTFAKGYFHQSS